MSPTAIPYALIALMAAAVTAAILVGNHFAAFGMGGMFLAGFVAGYRTPRG